MLNNPYFYFGILRKVITAFGDIFNNTTIVRTQIGDDDKELNRMLVPITYAPKEKYLVRLQQDPDLTRSIQIQIPRMSFEITSVAYDPTRQAQATLKNASYTPPGNSGNMQYSGVPYNIGMALYIYTRNIDDANQIVEQIFPLFNPEFNIPITYVPVMNNSTITTPIILTGVNQNIEYMGNGDNERLIIWELTFNIKTWFYGAVQKQGLITQANVRIFTSNPYATPPMNMDNLGSTINYQQGEWVYQGITLFNSTASGLVQNWDANNLILTVSNTLGKFLVNNYVTGANTHANWYVGSFQMNAKPIEIIITTPNPPGANIDSDYGYTTTITDYYA